MSNKPKKVIRLPQVLVLTGLSRSSIYKFMETNQFPKSISLGDRAVGWIEEDVYQWIDEKVNKNHG